MEQNKHVAEEKETVRQQAGKVLSDERHDLPHGGSHSDDSFLSAKSINKQLRADGKIIRKAVVSASQADELTTAQHWLSDNYHLLEAVRTDCMAALSDRTLPPFAKSDKDTPEGSATGLFLRCLSACADGVMPAMQDFVVHLARFPLCVAECILLPSVLRACFLHTAANALRSGSDDVLIACVRSLLQLRELDTDSFLPMLSPAERLLRKDPAGVYENMDDETKKAYRRQVAVLAKRTQTDEVSVVQQCLARAQTDNRHVGFFLDFPQKDRKKGVAFTTVQYFLAVLLSALTAWVCEEWWLFPLLFLPFVAVLQPLFDRLAARLFASAPQFSMRVKREIEEENRTLLTVAGLLPKAADVPVTEKHLADLYAANACGSVQVLYLADLSEADNPDMPTDETDIAAMCRAVDRLNARFGGGFALAVRPRVFSPTQRKYAGYERKRGALLALSTYLTDNGDGGFRVLHGDIKNLKKTKYMLTLDSDTVLSFGSLARLCAVAAHPLNRPQVDDRHSRVIKGYGILVPAAQTALLSHDAAAFPMLMTHGGGMGAYAGGVSERNMDVFGQSVFTGKGLIDVQTFYDLCAERFPEQRILSHDVLEGGIMRVGFEGRAAFAEHFPDHERSYFERMHRWLRGDWQNAAFIFRPLGTFALSAHTRFLLAENIRRALTPVSAMVLLATALFFGGTVQNTLLLIALLSVCAGEVYSCLSNLASQCFAQLGNRCFAFRLSAASGALLQALLLCAMLPQTAWVCVSAAVLSFWRLCVSKKHLLAWKTAAHSDRHADRKRMQSVVFPFSCALVLLWGGVLAKLSAVLFIVHLPLSAGSRVAPAVRRFSLPHAQKEQLIADCASMWQFFEDCADEKNHFLPPDNLQETPLRKVAHRTSPTNIGLYLCCMLAATDLAFIDAQGLCLRVSRCMDTVEKLVKYKGHLLNWYNTLTLAPLSPQYVSTVDSGNFVCSLTALREGLCEYTQACPELKTQIERIDRYLDSVDFKPLYNPLRKLFYVGLDAQTGEKSESCYDLYMSEARMTSYWCVSQGIVPPEHWQALGRTSVCDGGMAGAVSWTGTFFEYFMPCLFLPVRAHSFAAQSLRFCLSSQQKYARRHNIPWGITESGFYEFDPAMNYNYKAHGISALALKRRADCEKVVAPYSSYLALSLFPLAAVRNLQELRELNLTGRYGFCEAADFTKERTAGEDYCVVRSYMAHHVGMSMLSVVNCVSGNVFVRRFMRSWRTAPAQQLFNERFSKDEKIFRDVRKKEESRRPARPDRKQKAVPKNVSVFTNGEYTQFVDRYGRNVQLFSGHRITGYEQYGAGITAAWVQNGKLYPLAGHPDLKYRFSDGCAMSSLQSESLKIRCLQAVHPNVPASLFAVRADNATQQPQNADLCFYLTPYLLPVFSRNDHPAYEKLFVSCEYDPEEKIFVFTRHTEDATLCMAVGFWDNAPFSFETDREKVLSRGGAARFAVTKRFFNLQNGLAGTDRCLAINLPVRLSASQSAEHTLIVTAASSPKEAADRIRRIRAKPLPDSQKCARNPFSDEASLMQAAENLSAGLFFDAEPTEAVLFARRQNTDGKQALWSLGISGDRPIVILETDSDEEPSLLDSFMRLHAKLCTVGLGTDFVFLRGRSGGYSESAQEVLRQSIKRVGLPHAGGEMFALQKNTFPVSVLRTLCAFAQAVFPANLDSVRLPRFYVKREYESLVPTLKQNGFTENGYRFSEQPPVPWCQTYANATFGFLCSDNRVGFTWAGNAQLNKITPWINDTRADFDGERLLLGHGEKIFSLTDGTMCCFTDKEAMFEGEADGIRSLVCAATDEKAQKKRLTVHLNNTTDRRVQLRLAFVVRAVLGANNKDSVFVQAQAENGSVWLHNPTNTDVPGFVRLSCSQENTQTVFSEENLHAYLADGKEIKSNTTQQIILPAVSAVCTQLDLEPRATVAVQFHLTFARTKKAVIALENVPFRIAEPVRTCYKTGDETLDRFGNALLLHTVRSTRFHARCGFYQCGGAWGFRDQLQDAMCMLHYYPDLTRRQILRCAAVQFLQGDVLHWHHALFPKNAENAVIRGVRTRCSDDFLWLVLAVSQYVLHTGDKSILQVRIPYLDAPPLRKDEKDRYGEYRHTDVKETLYSHCLRAVARSLRFGAHGLSLMLGGDWNDAMGEVGIKGKGESVWLSMFTAQTLDRFAVVCNMQKEPHNAVRLRKIATAIRGNIDKSAWEIDRYLRAFFDDGTPLGSQNSSACKLDVLPQAFSMFCSMPDKNRVRSALATAYNTLFDRQNGLVRLFDTPFTPKDKKAGYINYYPGGVRENGGQYTHAAVWFALALYEAGYKTQAREVAKAICPASRFEDGMKSEQALRYRCEPFAPCGDVASAEGLHGVGGWSLYTGSAGWWLKLMEMLTTEENAKNEHE